MSAKSDGIVLDRADYIIDEEKVKHLWDAYDFLRRDVPKLLNGAKFNLNRFGSFVEAYVETRKANSLTSKEAAHCGFEGCAAGWLSVDSRFRGIGVPNIHDIGFYGMANGFGITWEASIVIFGNPSIDWGKGVGERKRSLDPHNPRVAANRIKRFLETFEVKRPDVSILK